MTPEQLAAQAIDASRRFDGVLHRMQVEKIALAHVAVWLHQQDTSVSDAAVRSTADTAIGFIISFFS